MQMKVFSAEWCVKCKELKRKLDMMKLNYEVVDFEQTPEVFEENKVTHGIPVVIFYKNNEEVKRFNTFNNKIYDEIKSLSETN